MLPPYSMANPSPLSISSIFSYNYQPVLFNVSDAYTGLIQIDETPSFHTSHRMHSRRLGLGDNFYLQMLSDRVSDLEFGFDRLRERTSRKRIGPIGEGKYTWTAEIKDWESDRKYKLTAEIKDKKYGKKVLDGSYNKLRDGINGKGVKYSPIDYRIKAPSGYKKMKKKMMMKGEKVKDCKGKFGGSNPRIVDHGAMYLRQAFAKRMDKKKGKKKQLSPQDAAALIQTRFRTHLFRRSYALRALRELAIVRNKFKEIKALFNNFSYRRKIARDAEERQKFSEKIIVLLLTVDGIEGTDLMVRAARKLIIEQLEAILDVVDPQPHGKSVYMRRRTFDMPSGTINKELAAGVAQMLDQDPSGSESFEANL